MRGGSEGGQRGREERADPSNGSALLRRSDLCSEIAFGKGVQAVRSRALPALTEV